MPNLNELFKINTETNLILLMQNFINIVGILSSPLLYVLFSWLASSTTFSGVINLKNIDLLLEP